MEFMMKTTLSWRPSLFVKKTARELLFQGFADPLLTAGSFFNPDSTVPMDRFGWFYGRNGTTWADDVIGMATGEEDYAQLGAIKTWKQTNRTHYPEECGQLKGSASGFLPVDPERKYFDLFSTDICRSIRFRKSQELVHNNLPVHRFTVNPMETFGNSSTNPENVCYNSNHPAGIHNSTGCKDEGILPVFVSLPHFLDADSSYLDQFHPGSLKPDPEIHSAFMLIQPDTSIPVQVRMRLQIILQLRKNENMGPNFENLAETFLPVIWFDARADTTPELDNTIWFLVYTPNIVKNTGIGLAILGSVLSIIFLHLAIKSRQTEEEILPQKIPENDDQEKL